jgi:hypothetical protein
MLNGNFSETAFGAGRITTALGGGDKRLHGTTPSPHDGPIRVTAADGSTVFTPPVRVVDAIEMETQC